MRIGSLVRARTVTVTSTIVWSETLANHDDPRVLHAKRRSLPSQPANLLAKGHTVLSAISTSVAVNQHARAIGWSPSGLGCPKIDAVDVLVGKPDAKVMQVVGWRDLGHRRIRSASAPGGCRGGIFPAGRRPDSDRRRRPSAGAGVRGLRRLARGKVIRWTAGAVYGNANVYSGMRTDFNSLTARS